MRRIAFLAAAASIAFVAISEPPSAEANGKRKCESGCYDKIEKKYGRPWSYGDLASGRDPQRGGGRGPKGHEGHDHEHDPGRDPQRGGGRDPNRGGGRDPQRGGPKKGSC